MRLLLISLFILTSHVIIAQPFSIKGKVIDAKTNTPISAVIVRLLEVDKWTQTNDQGEFTFENLKTNECTLEVHHLGYLIVREKISAISNETLLISLKPTTFSLDEVTVLETKSKELSTTTSIGKEAIEHVQPSTLQDILQLLPGATFHNPDLTDPQQIAIRDIVYDANTASETDLRTKKHIVNDANSSSGAALIIDGVQINNDANLQTFGSTKLTYSTTTVSEQNFIKFPTTIGNGIDLRAISTDRIESVEVITGIPSVTYGDLTSGAIVVKTKKGYTPWEAKFKSDPKLKLVSLSKGFKIKKYGTLNTGIDYTQFHRDLRSKYESYDRITGQIAFSNTLFPNRKPITFDLRLKAYSNIDSDKTDPEAQSTNEVYKVYDKGSQISLSGEWALSNKLITNLKYNFSGSIANKESYQKTYRSTGIEKISLSLTEGENEGIYLPAENLAELRIKGQPFSFNGQIFGSKTSLIGSKGFLKTIVGIEYRTKGNNGEGRIYDIKNPPTVLNNNTSTRPRSYKNIPNLSSFSAFIEEKTKIPISNTSLTIQLGCRFNNFQPESIINSELGWYTEPRFNAEYTLINQRDAFINYFAIRGGLGINYKSPSLIYMYPDKAFVNLVSLDHYPTNNPELRMVVFDTRIFDTSNNTLKPPKNYKREIGFDLKVGKVNANITGYSETLSDGLGFQNKYQFLEYKSYDASGVVYDQKPVISTLPYEMNNYIINYSQPVNNKKTKKYGVEYTINFGKLDILLTKLSINGAWKRNEYIFSTSPVHYLPYKSTGGQYELVGIYPAGESRINEQFNSNFRFVTHSTQLKLIVTTTVNLIWYEKFIYPYYNEIPDYLYNYNGDIIEFTDEMKSDINYYKYINVKPSNYFKTEKLPFLPMCNIRVSKELGNNSIFSFYANNFVNHRPLYRNKRNNSFIRRNQSIYFGAELKILIK